MRIRLAAVAISTVLIAAAAWANWNDTSTGIDLASLPAFPLTKVHSGVLKEGEQVQFNGLVARMSDPPNFTPEVLLEGSAKSGMRWAVHFPWNGMDGGVFSGDLDGNGTTDYVIVGGSIGNGRVAPPGWLTVLLMDTQGLPVPFEAPLYDGAGAKHVVGALRNSRAQLALGAYDENGWDNRNSLFRALGHGPL